ncbi:MAG: sterol desaturase family protein [Candidatus Eremiobacteraeota bacterium]|nr:sterol desaturase family protein [Candidatus Eremiobacteraeota bacterium]
MLTTIIVLIIVLIVGDFASTFFYHVPQHVWFKLHLRTHHDRRRSYWDHAVLSISPAVLADGLLGALPYIALAALLWHFSPAGALLGLILGQFHVWWRHTTELGWRTPRWVVALTRPFGIVLPEDHDGHHRNPEIEFGDIFRFYDAPARACIAFFRAVSRGTRRRKAALRSAMRRSGRAPVRRKGPVPSPGRG